MILSRFLPWLVAGLGAIYLMMMASAPARDSAGGMHLEEFGRLPIVHEGRIKPFDTLARNTLMAISGRQYVVDKDGNEQSAVQWLLDVMTSKISKVPFPAPASVAKNELFIRQGEVRNLIERWLGCRLSVLSVRRFQGGRRVA